MTARTFQLSQEEYESLIALARQGAQLSGNQSRVRQLEEWLKLIEKQNGVSRSVVTVLWQELDEPLPPGTFFPTTWPPTLKRTVELIGRLVSRADIDAVLSAHAKNPTSVMCTKDPNGVVGLTPIDQFFV
jgi:hypothetical protein